MSIFNKTPRGKIVRNKFDLSYTNNFTMKTGFLYPVLVEETAPGDIFVGGSGAVLRSQPTIAPNFTNYYYEMRYFYVPNRLLWSGFQEFMMDQKLDQAAVEKPNLTHPFLQFNPLGDGNEYLAPGSLADFLGVPTDCIERVNSLPFRAYYLIWNEYFRDQNLQDALNVRINEYVDKYANYELQRVNWRKDYFSSALPWTQRGQQVDMPATVYLRDGQFLEDNNLGPWQGVKTLDRDGSWIDASWSANSASNISGALRSLNAEYFGSSQTGTTNSGGTLGYQFSNNASAPANSITAGAVIDPNGTLGVDVNIRDLRFATAVQRFLEKEALVGGGRYADWIRGIYGVNIGDATLQRPLYLGGGRTGINISPVEQTSSTDSTSPQGTLAGKGYMSGMFSMNKPTLFAEHGWVIGLAYIRPEALYYRGLNRHMTKRDRFDYVIPGFERLGEQEISNREVYSITVDPDSQTTDVINARHLNDGTFGYQARQAEYKSHNNEIHGEIKTTLRQYAVARDFEDDIDTPIPLNGDFVECNPDEQNLFAVSEDVADPWIVNSRNVVTVYRNLQKYPKYGI